SLDAFARRRQLHDHVLVPAGVLAPLAQHTFQVGREHFHAHRPLDHVADLVMSVLLFCLFSFAISEGLVVTPSRIPRAAASRISLMLAVSIKNFMARPFVVAEIAGYCGFYSKLYSQATWLDIGVPRLEFGRS